MTNKKQVLILACHYDDEILGCAGLLHALSNDTTYETHVAIIASKRKVNGKYDEQLTAQLLSQSKQVQKILGIDHYHYLPLPDEELHENFREVRLHIENLRDLINPDLVFTHNPTDINQDHETVFKASKIAFRLQRIEKPFQLFTYEVLSSTDQGYAPFQPNRYLSRTWNDIDAKGRAMKCYTSEINDARCYEGIFHQARLRGIESGYHFAEAFKHIQSKG